MREHRRYWRRVLEARLALKHWKSSIIKEVATVGGGENLLQIKRDGTNENPVCCETIDHDPRDTAQTATILLMTRYFYQISRESSKQQSTWAHARDPHAKWIRRIYITYACVRAYTCVCDHRRIFGWSTLICTNDIFQSHVCHHRVARYERSVVIWS